MKASWLAYYTTQCRALRQRYPHVTDSGLRSTLITDYAISRADAASIVNASKAVR